MRLTSSNKKNSVLFASQTTGLNQYQKKARDACVAHLDQEYDQSGVINDPVEYNHRDKNHKIVQIDLPGVVPSSDVLLIRHTRSDHAIYLKFQ